MARRWPTREQRIRKQRTNLCPEAIDILRGGIVQPGAYDGLYQMTPPRQVEAARIMRVAGNYSSRFARALLLATPQRDLKRPRFRKVFANVRHNETMAMEREIRRYRADFTAVDESYGTDVLDLVVARAYLAKLLGNSAIERYLQQKHPKLLAGFRSIVALPSLDEPHKVRIRDADHPT